MKPVLCALCGGTIDKPERADRWTSAWERPRSAGGGNAFRLREQHDKWAHPVCVDMESKKVGALQGSLL